MSGVLVIVLMAIGAIVGGVAATGGFSRIIGASIPTDAARGIDSDIAGDASTAASSSSTTTGPAPNPDSPPPEGGGGGGAGGGSGKYAFQAAAMGPIDWAIIAFVAILVFGVIAAKVRIRGPTFGIVALVVVVLVVAAAIGTAAQGVDRDGDGDVDDFQDVIEAGFSGSFIFDGTIGYSDGSQEDVHTATPLFAITERGGREISTMVFQVVLDARCETVVVDVGDPSYSRGCTEARLTGGFIAFTASRPPLHAEGAFLKEGPRVTIPANVVVRAGQPLELWRVAFDNSNLQSAIADSDGLGTYFLNLVGQVRFAITNETGNASPLIVDFAWPNLELHVVDSIEAPVPAGRGCSRMPCAYPISIVRGTFARWWYLNTTAAPDPSSREVLEDFGVIG